MDKRKLSFVLGMIIVGNTLVASANTITKFKIDADTQYMTVEGELYEDVSGAIIDFDMKDTYGNLVIKEQTMTDSDGKYKFSINLEKALLTGGEFSAVINSQIEENVLCKTEDGKDVFNYYSPSELDSIFEELAGVKGDVDGIAAVIQKEGNADKLSYADTRLRKLFDAGKTREVATFMKNDGYTKETVMKTLKRIAVIKSAETGDESDVKDVFSEELNVLVLPDNATKLSDNQIYKNLKTTQMNSFYSRLAASSVVYNSTKDFFDDVEDVSIVTQLYDAKGTDAVYGVLSDNSARIDFTKYNNPSNDKTAVLSAIGTALENNRISKLKDVQNILDVNIEKSGGSTGGNSGSGGGSGKTTVSAPSSMVSGGQWDETVVEPNVIKFKDLTGFEWAEESINSLVNRGVLNGYSVNEFSPASNLTRAEFCKIGCLVFGIDCNVKEASFKDVSGDDWFSKYVYSLSDKKIVNGVGDGVFNPNSPITREDVCVIAYRLLKIDNGTISPSDEISFEDKGEISDYAIEAVKYLNEKGIIKGYDGSFFPKKTITRAEIAVMMNRIYDYRNGVIK